ncbi:MAG: hypothetical protein JXR73_11625 [Candidatus Omnitrophica bacterium]|nr:hypothetical protein [Candidatus Omnitrophota bacterium]
MSDSNIQCSAYASLRELFGSNGDGVSMERVEAVFSKMIRIASEQAQTHPHSLVRVVHGSRVAWMTQQQAADYLKESGENAQLREDVEKALKGELKHIRRELELLLVIAQYTFEQFRNNRQISLEAVQRIEPGLQRRQSEISQGVSQAAESEAIVENARRRNPVITEFEAMMAEFLQEKSKGNMQRAGEIAKALSEKKKLYVLATRAIEPDVRTIYYHRLNLQKTKKRLLHTQNEMCSSRQNSLIIELKDLKQRLSSVSNQMNEAETAGQDNAADLLNRRDSLDEGIKRQMSHKVCELASLKKESEILDRQESQVDSVISVISEQMDGEAGVKINLETHRKRKIRATPSTKNKSVSTPKSGGMYSRKNNK